MKANWEAVENGGEKMKNAYANNSKNLLCLILSNDKQYPTLKVWAHIEDYLKAIKVTEYNSEIHTEVEQDEFIPRPTQNKIVPLQCITM